MAQINISGTVSYEFDLFCLIPSEHQLLREGTPVPLPPKTFETLVLLVENNGHLIEKEELMRRLWPDTFVEEANLTHHIWTLRKALGDTGNGQRYIQTVPRRGYRFVADVHLDSKQPLAPNVSGDSEQSEILSSVRPAETRAGALWSVTRNRVLAVSLIVATVIGLGIVAYNRMRSRPPVNTGKVVLLVLPFDNASGNPEEQYFSDGMTEEMITELANLHPERLRVIPRVSAVRVKSSGKSIDEMGRELGGIDYVLESSIYRFNDRVRINTRLINVRDDSNVWAHSYERELRDVLALQSEVAHSISQEISLQLNATDQLQPATVRQINPEAHEAYLKALYFFDKFTESGMKTSIEYCQVAIQKDPGFAPPYARMARAYGVLGNFNTLRPDEAYPKQKEAALKALEIDGRQAEARTALGWSKFFYDRDWDGAREEFERAIELSPNLAIAHQGYGGYLVSMGQFDRAQAEILEAQRLDPVNLNIKCDVGWFLYFARRPDESIVRLKEVLAMDPNYSIAHIFLSLAYDQKGMFDEALAEAQKALALFEGSETRLASLGYAYARAGKKQEAQRILERLKVVSRHRYVSSYTTGLIYASLGQPDEALDWLQKAYDDRFWMMAYLKVDPRWDPLRSNPRFVEIMHRTGLLSQNAER